MPCYTTVRTQIRDLDLAIDAARKLGWDVEARSEVLPEGISARFRTPDGSLQLRPTRDGTYEASGVSRGMTGILVRAYAEEGVLRWARSKGYFAQVQARGTKRVLTLRSFGG